MEIRPVDNSLQHVSVEVEPLSPARGERPPSSRELPLSQQRRGRETKEDTVTISPTAARKLDEERQKQQIMEMKSTEAKVKAHEAAHMAAGGQQAGGATYEYQTGPDGKSYITGGEVQIDLSPGRTPQETIRKMEVVIRAALAPADPSPQDRAVAARAAALMAEAQQEIATGASSGAAEERNRKAPSSAPVPTTSPDHEDGTTRPGTPSPFSVFA